MDEERFKQLHYELWTWVSEKPLRTKYRWPMWKGIEDDYGHVENYCFACEYFGDCFYCPLNKGTNDEPDCTLYYEWVKLYENYVCEISSRQIVGFGAPAIKEESNFNEAKEKEKIKQAALKIRDAWK